MALPIIGAMRAAETASDLATGAVSNHLANQQVGQAADMAALNGNLEPVQALAARDREKWRGRNRALSTLAGVIVLAGVGIAAAPIIGEHIFDHETNRAAHGVESLFNGADKLIKDFGHSAGAVQSTVQIHNELSGDISLPASVELVNATAPNNPTDYSSVATLARQHHAGPFSVPFDTQKGESMLKTGLVIKQKAAEDPKGDKVIKLDLETATDGQEHIKATVELDQLKAELEDPHITHPASGNSGQLLNRLGAVIGGSPQETRDDPLDDYVEASFIDSCTTVLDGKILAAGIAHAAQEAVDDVVPIVQKTNAMSPAAFKEFSALPNNSVDVIFIDQDGNTVPTSQAVVATPPAQTMPEFAKSIGVTDLDDINLSATSDAKCTIATNTLTQLEQIATLYQAPVVKAETASGVAGKQH